MRLSKLAKIIVGLLTAWEVILPVTFVIAWFLFIIAVSVSGDTIPDQAQLPDYFLPIFLVLICSIFPLIGLRAFYLVHIILNKSGSATWRAILGVGLFLFPLLAIPAYYFIYILPENPPQWSLESRPAQTITQVVIPPPPPNA